MAMLPNLRIGAPPAMPGSPGTEESPAPDLFAQLLGLLPNAPSDAALEGETVTTTLGLGAGPAEDDPEATAEDAEAAILFLPTFEMQRAAAPLAAAQAPAAGAAPVPAAPAPAAAPAGPAPQAPSSDSAPVAAGHVPGEAPANAPVPTAKSPAAPVAAPVSEAKDAPEAGPVPEPLRRAIQALKAGTSARATPAAVEAAAPETAVPRSAAPALAAAAVQPVQQPLPNPVQQPVLAMAEAPAQPAAEPPAPLPRETVAEALERQLDVSADGEWLDQLARDIVRTGAAGGEGGALRFRLNPETLGQVRVELSQGAEGATVRIAAETEGARALLADAQPRLLAEARAQGVRIAESEVSLAGSGSSPEQQQRREEAQAEPRLRTARAGRDAPAETADAPAHTRSDRYA